MTPPTDRTTVLPKISSCSLQHRRVYAHACSKCAFGDIVGGAAATLAIAWWKMENAHQGLTIRPSRLWLAKSIFSAWGVQVKDTGLLLVSC
jgi:hypothetical protein